MLVTLLRSGTGKTATFEDALLDAHVKQKIAFGSRQDPVISTSQSVICFEVIGALQRINYSERHTQALILAPTRELANQRLGRDEKESGCSS